MTVEQLIETALAALREGQAVVAEHDLRQALSLQPDHPRATLFLGVALARQERWPEAEETLQHGCRIEPVNALMHYNLGRLYQQRELAAEAVECYQQALRLDPSHQGARDGLRRLTDQLPDHRFAEQPLAAEQQVRCVEPGSALKCGLYLGLPLCALIVAGFAVEGGLRWDGTFLVAGMVVAVATVVVIMLTIVVQVGTYNYLAMRVQPVTIEVEPDGRWYRVTGVEPYPCGRMGAVVGPVSALVNGSVLAPLVSTLSVAAIALSEALGLGRHSPASLAAGPIVMAVVFYASLVVAAGGYVLGVLLAVFYNWTVTHTGGLRFEHRWRRGRSELARLEPWSTTGSLLLSTWLFWWPFAALAGLLMLANDLTNGVVWLAGATFGVPLAVFASAIIYNGCAAVYGGLCVDLRED